MVNGMLGSLNAHSGPGGPTLIGPLIAFSGPTLPFAALNLSFAALIVAFCAPSRAAASRHVAIARKIPCKGNELPCRGLLGHPLQPVILLITCCDFNGHLL